MADIIVLPEEEVIKKYHETKSVNIVAKYFKVSVTPIIRVLNTHNVKRYGFQGLNGKKNPNFGNKWTPEMKAALAAKKKGKTWEEIMGKEKAEQLKRKFSENYSGKNNPFFGRKHSFETKEKLMNINKGKIISDKQKAKLREFYKNNPQYIINQRNRAIARIKEQDQVKCYTSIELIINRVLQERGIKAEKQYVCGGFVFDFAIPENKILIECDGDYWHYNNKVIKNKEPNSLQKSNIKSDSKKNKFAKENGWVLIRLWENEIRNNSKGCVDRIEKEIQNAR
ncbi:NUMOD3 domain-containing DNA-binding protein [Candidatus Dojkabacteria bacterium]|jgi:very-short-patch-repair endonuclease|nr:NUMOD3 domain-containing DNA-binding protein [Candidatus Dojkabacteria bacterium]